VTHIIKKLAVKFQFQNTKPENRLIILISLKIEWKFYTSALAK